MSIFTALFAGVNGLNSNGDAVSIIGDNIANVNTHGFKEARPEFEDVIAGVSSVEGLGSRLQGVTTMHSQGGFESTSVVTDMAIDGKGFFSVYDVDDATIYYSRAGQFHIDKDGFLVNVNQQRLQGFMVDDAGDLSTVTSDLELPLVPSPPLPTSEIVMQANLDAGEAVPAAFDVTDPIATSNFAVGTTVYDSLGNDHAITTYFRKTGANAWEYNSVVAAADHTLGADTICTSGTFTFDGSGKQTATAVTLASDFDFAGGADQNQAIAFDFGSTTATGSGLDGITQFGSDSTLTGLSQDGYKSGNLSSLVVSTDGTVTGNNTNGTTTVLGRITLTTFPSEGNLRRVGGNNFAATLESGEPLSDGAESGGRGSILSSNLEQSNVDLAAELIKMVIIQRGFQANSRTISVVNELLGSLVTLGS
jgi:flagellar hook protein FlgE